MEAQQPSKLEYTLHLQRATAQAPAKYSLMQPESEQLLEFTSIFDLAQYLEWVMQGCPKLH